MDEPNPFAQEEEPGDIASVSYRYVETCGFLLCAVLHLYSVSNTGLASISKLVGVCILTKMKLRVPTVRESQGILSESGKVRENREGQGKVREF